MSLLFILIALVVATMPMAALIALIQSNQEADTADDSEKERIQKKRRIAGIVLGVSLCLIFLAGVVLVLWAIALGNMT